MPDCPSTLVLRLLVAEESDRQQFDSGCWKRFEILSLHKVWLTVHVHNNRAIRTYLKAGFVVEGILRDEFRLAGQFVDVFYMGMCRTDFDRLDRRGRNERLR